jgi:hypothetical protein
MTLPGGGHGSSARFWTRSCGAEPARYQQRDWEGDEFGSSVREWATVAWSPIVLVEGVTCARRESVGKLAYTVWVDAPAEERLRRGIERDGEDHRGLWPG